MNYRHIFHAGNFADVFKHIVLIALIESLLLKDKPFCYVDTHAGIGRYDLSSKEAQKTMEFVTGVAELQKIKDNKPPIVEKYLEIIQEINPSQQQLFYPGSPLIARALLRPMDKMILTELHPVDAITLKNEFKNDKQVAVHLLDGYQALKAFLPPDPRRGLVLIDPPYEVKNEFNILLKSMKMALSRWSSGIFAIWYPIKNRYLIHEFERSLRKISEKPFLTAELSLYPDDAPIALNGSGLFIINPPWQLDKKLQQVLPWLLKALDTQKQGKYRIELIKPISYP
jgi:23S rRNA (adenine2030-N6)-methyltransferase